MSTMTGKFLFIALFLVQIGFAQNNSSFSFEDTLKKEVAQISIRTASMQGETGGVNGYSLTAVPLKKCTDSAVSFSYRSYAPGVYIHVRKGEAGKVIDAIVYSHVKYMEVLPDNAFADLKGINLCLVNSSGKNKGTSNCKVFRSEDGQRTYIYLLNGSGANRCEIIWVLRNGNYYSRIINPVPEG
jgi:hypothetical protein